MPVLVDTHVLIYAYRTPKEKDVGRVHDLTQSARQILASHTVCISAITLLELLRGLKPHEAAALGPKLSRLEARAVTARVADRANELLQHRNQRQAVCPRCLGAKQTRECVKCGAKVSTQQRLNDALIAATAETEHDIEILYTADSGIIEFGQYMNRAEVRDLPNPHGPLFDKVHFATIDNKADDTAEMPAETEDDTSESPPE